METIEKSIEVDAPLSMVYNQWTQFEDFPEFMEGVEEVTQIDDKRLHWRARIAGKEKEWQAEIFEQIPDQRIAWRSTTGAHNSGMVHFQSLGPDRTRVNLTLNYDPQGFVESVADALGVVSRRVQGDLERFREFIEARGLETGGWRGEIEGRQVRPSSSTTTARSRTIRASDAAAGTGTRGRKGRTKSPKP